MAGRETESPFQLLGDNLLTNKFIKNGHRGEKQLKMIRPIRLETEKHSTRLALICVVKQRCRTKTPLQAAIFHEAS